MAKKTLFDELHAFARGDKEALLRASALIEQSRAERAAFNQRLAEELHSQFELIDVQFGRGPKQEPVWVVTVRRYGKHMAVRATTMLLPAGKGPYDLSLAPLLAEQVRAAWARPAAVVQ